MYTIASKGLLSFGPSYFPATTITSSFALQARDGSDGSAMVMPDQRHLEKVCIQAMLVSRKLVMVSRLARIALKAAFRDPRSQ